MKANGKKFNFKAILWLGIVLLAFLVMAGITYGVRMGVYNDDFGKASSFFVSKVLVSNLLGSVTILIGVVVFAGYLILGRGFTDSFLGMVKAMIGVIMLKIGASVLVGMAKPIFAAIGNLGTDITPLDPYFVWNDSAAWLKSLNAGYEAWIAYALLIGFAFNIVMVILRKWTNMHSVMLTGHVMFQQAAVVVPVTFFTMFFTQGSGSLQTFAASTGAVAGTILISGLVLGLYWSVGSSATIKGSDVVTEKAGFCVGHQQMLGLSIAYGIGKYFGKKEESAETKKISNKVKIFEDNIFTQTLLIFVLFLTLILIIQFASTKPFGLPDGSVNGAAYGQWNVDAQFWVINILLGSMKLVTSILVLQAGVRMFVTELQQSFQGIAEKLAPGAVIAVDVAATYGFSMNSVTYGFAAGTVAQFIAVGILIGISRATSGAVPIVIPLFITLFFNSGSIGVFANASGGYKASLIVPAIFGFIEIFVIAAGLWALKHTQSSLPTEYAGLSMPFKGGFLGMFDWNFFFGLALLASPSPIASGIVVGGVIPVALIVLSQLIDTNRQTKATLLQKVFKIKPQLIME
ncbi:PTS ascorbate transporter subunit IIC [Mycoplasma buteonis]|uniref:PTS ascorbate transporter subunit IIC n=1 Tax=Mycoplasma buteonis TaxID=171280 RepID=UPI00056D5672|nr:PTS ascorbate transporter subunit IIC [Mycoplasma buteonis]